MADPLHNISIVLDQPQDLVNIAGVIRIMMNMGLSELRLVRPAEWDEYRILGIAHRADQIIESARHFETLDEALADSVYVVGTTGRARTAKVNYGRPAELAPAIVDHARRGTVTLLFGREDRGLSNRALDRCHAVVVIPTAPDYPSLNLAHAAAIVAYVLLLATEGGERPLPAGRRRGRPATRADLEEMYQVLEAALHAVDFFKSRNVTGVMRALRTLLARAEPDLREAHLIRAIGYEVVNYLERMDSPKK